MQVQRYFGAKEFLDRVEGFLEKEEAANNLALGITVRARKDLVSRESGPNPLFAAVEYEGSILLVLVMTPPHRLILCGKEEGMSGALDAAVSYLLQEGIPIPGVLGPRKLVDEFAAVWSQRAAFTRCVSMNQMIYRLDKVNSIELPQGELAFATRAEDTLIADWMYAFSESTLDKLNREDSLTKAKEAIAEERAYVWHYNGPVSMAIWGRQTRNGVVISGVYTPPASRNHGFATAVVATLTQKLLERGNKFCSLYTDLANPTSNSIYRNIGFYPIQESIVYDFKYIAYEEARDGDLESVRSLFLEYADSLGIDLSFQNFAEEIGTLPGKYGKPDGALILARTGSELCGCVALRKIGSRICEMKRLYVRPRFRKLGIGEELARRILAEASSIGYASMRLDTLPSMKSALRLYRSLGFQEIDPYTHNPIEGAIFMEKAL